MSNSAPDSHGINDGGHELTVERVISGHPAAVFDAFLR